MLENQLKESLFISEELKKDHPEISDILFHYCNSSEIEIKLIHGANDYWCRDFMPVQINEEKFVQFSYDPSYYQHPKYQHLKTDIKMIDNYPSDVIQSDLVIDGGNICLFHKQAIITDKALKDNLHLTKETVTRYLCDILQIEELTIIPTLPYDITGHADGMVWFIDEETLLLNDFSLICSKSYWNKLLHSLKQFKLILLPNDLHLNKYHDDATGDYINMVKVKDLIFIPMYGRLKDTVAYNIIKKIYPAYKIVQIPSGRLSCKGGILHCATWNCFSKTFCD